MSETETPDRITPSVMHLLAAAERERVGRALENVIDRCTAVQEAHAQKLAEIARLQREVSFLDDAVANLENERADLIAMDDALAEEIRALERILVRSSGR